MSVLRNLLTREIMSNPDLYGSARRYIAANGVIGSAASKMAQLNREQEAKIAEITRSILITSPKRNWPIRLDDFFC